MADSQRPQNHLPRRVQALDGKRVVSVVLGAFHSLALTGARCGALLCVRALTRGCAACS